MKKIDVIEKERAYRIKSLDKQIAKTSAEYDDLLNNPRTFSYSVAFGNPGGCMSKSLSNRINKYHEKLSELSKKQGRLELHKKILQGEPLTTRDKRDYLYNSHWGGGWNIDSNQVDPTFNRALQDTPKYVQKAYTQNYGN